MSTPSSPDTGVRPTRHPGPPSMSEQQSTPSPHTPGPQQTPQQPQLQAMRPQIQIPTSNAPIRGEYLIIVPNRQPGVPGYRYPFIPIRNQMLTTPTGATILQRPALIRGVAPQGMGVHPTVIPTSQPFGIAGVPATMATGQNPAMMHQQATIVSSASTPPSQMTSGDALQKGINFFHKLITQMHIPSKKISLTNLIQSLIDGNKTPEEFASQLQGELGAAPQPQLIPFLELLLPTLRHSMNAGVTKLPGIRPPSMQNMQPTQIIQHIGHPTENRVVISPATMTAPTSMPSNDSQPINTSITTTTSIAAPLIAPGTPTLSVSGQAAQTAKKKKTPLPPGQKSAYAIKKEAREARKRERELAAQNIKVEVTDDKVETEQKQKIEKSPIKPKPDRARQDKQKKQEKQLESLSVTLRDDDDVNDVAAMGGVNLAEESQKIMASGAELVGTQIRSCKDEPFFDTNVLAARISKITKKHGLGDPSEEVVTLISHATQERLKDIVERLGVLAEHRTENLKLNPKYEISNDVKGQMKFLAELDRIEKRRYEEQERELLLRVAKSRSKAEDPEQQKLRQKAKDMQRAEQEEVRQREANMTALLAIGPRKKLKTGSVASMSSFSQQSSISFRETRPNIDLRQDTIRRIKRVNMRDLQVLFELDRTHLDRLAKIATQ